MKFSKRNPSIEFIRLIACLIVVACHVNFQLAEPAGAQALRTFYFCLFSDGVSIFFMITGCFFFENDSLISLWKRTAKKIILPTVLLFFVCLFLSSAKFPLKYFDHTWYIFVYLTVLLLFPLLKKIAAFLERSPRRKAFFLLASFLLFTANDLCQNRLCFFGFSPLSGLLPACILILWGHLLRRRCSSRNFSGKPGIFPVAFLLINLIRTLAQLGIYAAGSDYNLRVWHSSFGLAAAASILMFGLTVKISRAKDSVRAGASCTFGVYLTHPLIAGLLSHLNFWKTFQTSLFSVCPYPAGSAVFLLCGTLLLFFCSLILTWLLRAAGQRASHLFSRMR